MKVEGYLFAAGTVFYVAVAVIYGVLTWLFGEGTEPVGTTALVLTGGLAFLVGFYILFTARRLDLRPEDRIDAEIGERAGEYGFFSPHSWWPLPIAVGAAMIALGVIFAWWLVFLGVITTGLAVIGMVFEYYRGSFAH